MKKSRKGTKLAKNTICFKVKHRKTIGCFFDSIGCLYQQNLKQLKTKIYKRSEQEKCIQVVYISSLLHQELHPVPRNFWVSTMQSKLDYNTNHQKSDLEPFKKHTPFDTPIHRNQNTLLFCTYTQLQNYSNQGRRE